MCHLKFLSSEVRKRVTIKSVMLTRNHMIQRGIHIYDHFNVQSESNLCHNVSICDLCYTLVVEELHLLEAERKFAVFQHINVGAELIKVECQREAEEHHKMLHRPPMITKNMFMWRIMFFFQCIDDVPEGLFEQHMKYHLQYKIFNQTAQVRMHMNKLDMQGKGKGRDLMTSALVVFILDMISTKRAYKHKHIPMDIIKMHFFFTQMHDDPNEFLKNLKLNFRITDSDEWNDVRLKGESQIFQPIIHTDQKQTTADYMLRPLTFQQEILLFNPLKEKKVKLKMVVGIVRDTPELDTSGFNLYGEAPVFYSDEKFHSHHPFPETFIDVFCGYLERQKVKEEKREELMEEDAEGSSADVEASMEKSSILEPMQYKAEVMRRGRVKHEISKDFHSPYKTWTNKGKIGANFDDSQIQKITNEGGTPHHKYSKTMGDPSSFHFQSDSNNKSYRKRGELTVGSADQSTKANTISYHMPQLNKYVKPKVNSKIKISRTISPV